MDKLSELCLENMIEGLVSGNVTSLAKVLVCPEHGETWKPLYEPNNYFGLDWLCPVSGCGKRIYPKIVNGKYDYQQRDN